MVCFPAPGHDHQHCMASVLATAERLCAQRQVRLTAQRRCVLEIVAASHSAIGAYEIMARLGKQRRRPAPISVYRALDFLMAQRLVALPAAMPMLPAERHERRMVRSF